MTAPFPTKERETLALTDCQDALRQGDVDTAKVFAMSAGVCAGFLGNSECPFQANLPDFRDEWTWGHSVGHKARVEPSQGRLKL